jgi:hypothetical protein
MPYINLLIYLENFSPWSTSNRNSSNIWITTTTAESGQNKRACRLQFTDNKPFRLLEQFLLQNMTLTFWDHLKTADVLLFIW